MFQCRSPFQGLLSRYNRAPLDRILYLDGVKPYWGAAQLSCRALVRTCMGLCPWSHITLEELELRDKLLKRPQAAANAFKHSLRMASILAKRAEQCLERLHGSSRLSRWVGLGVRNILAGAALATDLLSTVLTELAVVQHSAELLQVLCCTCRTQQHTVRHCSTALCCTVTQVQTTALRCIVDCAVLCCAAL